ncbi:MULTISPECIES: TetR/AcrR family transcriptional regulator [Clostridium]|uniref:TetR/AcrR family transcriptional regulator n=1 Tax=Clostridium TaxID=1485 RepID=UPI00082702A3|nr:MULTISPECIES: TetR/AcrR family transcriptional regulator [Clostridium]PJI09295.1 TetR/AcrR family transcriptional regulator [Clostridium sp. CT7]
MEKLKYHHGNLRNDMIQNGLKLLTNKGYEEFSLRKVAKMCGVSHTTPYKHFKNKDDLICAIISEGTEKFKKSLEKISLEHTTDFKAQVLELGKKYIKFMVENPDYFKLLLMDNLSNKVFICNHNLLCIKGDSFDSFRKSALNYLNSVKGCRSNEELNLSIISLWSTIHGLAIMLTNKTLVYSGDYLDLVDKILSRNLSIEA